MTFQIPARTSEPDSKKPENRFHFEDAEGNKLSVPKLSFITQESAVLFEQGKELLASYAAFDDDAALEVYKSLDREQIKAFDAAWVAESKVSPGESGGSADS